MLSPDPVKRSINPYPYCDNDPVNYNDPTGEIANILVGAGLGGFFGGAAVSSEMRHPSSWTAGSSTGEKPQARQRGALVGSGVGVLGAFATDFAAGTVGSALEQGIGRGRIDIGESLLSGAGNALSEVLYGTGELKGVKGRLPQRSQNWRGDVGDRQYRKGSRHTGNGRGYQSGRAHGGAGHSRTGENGGFSLGGFVKDVLTGAVTGGLGSAGFYGAGKAVDALWGSVAGRADSVESTELVTYYPSNNGVVLGTERKVYLLPGDKN